LNCQALEEGEIRDVGGHKGTPFVAATAAIGPVCYLPVFSIRMRSSASFE
jgi:hypothetical protein